MLIEHTDGGIEPKTATQRESQMKDNIRLNGTKTSSISETLKYYVPVLIHFQSELARVSIFLLCKSDETKTIKHTTKFFLMICCCSFSFPPHLFLPILIIHLAHSHFYRFNDRQLVCLARCLPFDLLLLLLQFSTRKDNFVYLKTILLIEWHRIELLLFSPLFQLNVSNDDESNHRIRLNSTLFNIKSSQNTHSFDNASSHQK